jgi:gliding motility-associated-like protein
MKIKHLIVVFFTLLAYAGFSQNTQIFSENFESGGGLWILNGGGIGTNTGTNEWIVNNSYNGGAGYPKTMSEDSTFGGSISFAPFSYYLHIYDQPSGFTDCLYAPANVSDRFAYLWDPQCTLDAYNVSLNFFYLCQGSPTDYGTVYYSLNFGPWIQTGAAQYNSKYKWQYTTITDPAFSNASNLRIGFRWQNNGSGTDTSAFAIDDISIVGTYDTSAHPVTINTVVTPDTICAGGGYSLNVSFTTSDTLCYGVYDMILSDSNGNFNNSPAGWTVSMGYPSVNAGPFNLPIPANIPAGHCYRFRVDRASNPAVIGIETGCIYIENCPPTITTMQPLVTSNLADPVCAGSVIQVPFNSTGTYGNTNIYFAELSDSAGNFTGQYDTLGLLPSNTAYPSIPPGTVSGIIPFGVKASCHYYIRVISDTPHVIGSTYGPFCIQHCDIWSDTAATSIQACVKSCYADPGGFNIKIPFDIHKYDSAEHYAGNNKFEVQLLSTMTFAVVATGHPFGAYLDSVSGNLIVHVPCGDSICTYYGGPQTFYMRIVATNSNQPDSMLGNLLFLTVGYPQDSLYILTSPATTTYCPNTDPSFYAYNYSSCTNNWFGGSTYSWYLDNVLLPTIDEFDFSFISVNPGAHTLMVRETNNGCKGPLDTLKFTYKGLPPDNITGPTRVCKGDTGLYTVPFTNNTFYKWRYPANFTIDTSNNSLRLKFDSVGHFVVKIILIDTCGADSSTRNITVIAPPAVTIANPQPVCKGAAINLDAVAGNGNSYAWKPSANVSCANCASTDVTPPSTTEYTVIVTNSNNCSTKDSVKVIIKPLPTDTACCSQTINQGSSASIAVLPGAAGNTYAWAPSAGLSCTNCINPVASPTVTTTYTVTITDSANCVSIDSVTIIVNEECGTVYVPTAFSPNGDKENDMLFVRGGCITDLDFIVYDRWGNKIFETQNQSIGWDGTYKGQPMNTGTYVYYLQAITSKNGVPGNVTKKGNVTLVR